MVEIAHNLVSEGRSNRVEFATLIKPGVLYSHETWTMLVEDQRALAVFERKVLRTIFGGLQMENGAWRRRMNHELQELLGEPSAVHRRWYATPSARRPQGRIGPPHA